MSPEHEAELTPLDRLEELEDEPALADARNSDEREELRLELARHSRERLAQQRQLALSPDERCSSDSLDADPSTCAQGLPARHGTRLPLRRDRPRPPVVDRALCRAIRRLVDEDRAGLGRSLESRRGVHHVSRGHSFTGLGPRVERYQRFAGRDSDADFEVTLLRERVSDRQCRADGALGVVLMCDRSAEHRHHCIADELLDRTAEALELRAEASVVRLQHASHVLRIHLLRACGEADEIAEQAGDHLPLLARRRRHCERRAALRAELGGLGVLRSASRTGHAVIASSASPSRM